MGYHVKREHLIGDKTLPYELTCNVVVSTELSAWVEVVTPSGMTKRMVVRADQVYFKLEAV